MASILDYLDWLGGQTLGAVPLNEVDCVVLAQVAYLDLAGAVPPLSGGIAGGAAGPLDTTSVAEAAARFLALHPREELYGAEGLVSPLTPFVLQRMAGTRRFSDVRVGGWAEVFDPGAPEQFAAVTFLVPDGAVTAFRGTDDTLDGWREDFVMSYRTVPAQLDAARYLERVAAATTGGLWLCGHSKGGNLALYATSTAHAEVRARVEGVWCADSPGLAPGMGDGRGRAELAGRVRLLVPEYCVVGALFDQAAAPEVVASDANGILQHDAMTWQVLGTSFVRRERTCTASRRFAAIVRELVAGRDARELERLTDAIFSCLAASGATTVSGLAVSGLDGLGRVLAAMDATEEPERTAMRRLALALLGQAVTEALGLPQPEPEGAGAADAPAGGRAGNVPVTGGDAVGGPDAGEGTGGRGPGLGDGAGEAAGHEATGTHGAAGRRAAPPPLSLDEMRAFRLRRRLERAFWLPLALARRLAGAVRKRWGHRHGGAPGNAECEKQPAGPSGHAEAPRHAARGRADGTDGYVTIPRRRDA